MDDLQATSTLIGDIYDAAIDPTLWPNVLKSTCEHIGGTTSALMSQDAIHAKGNTFFVWGGNASYRKAYFDTYMKIDPILLSAHCYARVGEVYSPEMLMPYDEYIASRFFKEWAVPQGLCDLVWSVFEKSATSAAGITVLRHEQDGRVDDTVLHRMGVLVPHFRRSVAIGKVIDFHKNETAALADAFDGLSAAVFLLDADGRIVHANTSGQALLNEGEVIRLAGKRLTATDSHGDRLLREGYLSAPAGDVTLSASLVHLTTRDGDKWVAHLLSLNSGSRRKTGAAYAAVTAAFLRKAALDLPAPLEAMCKLFHLTPSE